VHLLRSPIAQISTIKPEIPGLDARCIAQKKVRCKNDANILCAGNAR